MLSLTLNVFAGAFLVVACLMTAIVMAKSEKHLGSSSYLVSFLLFVGFEYFAFQRIPHGVLYHEITIIQAIYAYVLLRSINLAGICIGLLLMISSCCWCKWSICSLVGLVTILVTLANFLVASENANFLLQGSSLAVSREMDFLSIVVFLVVIILLGMMTYYMSCPTKPQACEAGSS